MYNSAVLFVEAGGSCDVLCKYPYVGTPGEALERWEIHDIGFDACEFLIFLPWEITSLWSFTYLFQSSSTDT